MAYLTEVLKDETLSLEKFNNPLQVKDWMIENQQLNKLNKLKKSNPKAFFYWFNALKLYK